MNTQTADICCSFGDVAVEYYPFVQRGTAIRKLRENIKNNLSLESALEETGFFNDQNVVTPLQRKLIKHYLAGR